MKLFWLIIGVLAVATVIVCLPKRSETKPTAVAELPESGLEASSSVAASLPAPASPPVSDRSSEASLAAELRESVASRRSAETEDLNAEFVDNDSEASTSTADQSHGGMSIERRADGSIKIDDRFIVRGSGTAENPYRITWELLVSAEETYAPGQDMYEMPPRIEFLNGKHVLITGFLFTAMLRDETTELLVMRNMWDGCCVGVPPSSYDAIEVNLRKPLWIKSRGLLESGVLEGVLHVDPYVKDGWLLGLFVMDDGVVDFGEM